MIGWALSHILSERASAQRSVQSTTSNTLEVIHRESTMNPAINTAIVILGIIFAALVAPPLAFIAIVIAIASQGVSLARGSSRRQRARRVAQMKAYERRERELILAFKALP